MGLTKVTYSMIDGSPVNPLDYGAVGDGVTNSIDAFIAAAETGLPIVVTDGSYTITVANQTQADTIMGMFDRLHLFCTLLTVNIAAGKFTFTSPAEFKMTNGDRLKIVGATPTTLTFSALTSITSNGAGDHDVVITFTDASSVAIDDYLIIRSTTGTNQKVLEGVWKVTNKVSNAVTIKNTAQVASFSTTPTLSGGTFKKMNTVLYYTDSMGFHIVSPMGADSGYSCGMKNFVIAGNNSGDNTGILMEYGTSLTLASEFGVHGFGRFGVYAIYNGVLAAQNVCSCANTSSGFYALSGSVMQLVNAISNGNATYGIVSSVGSSVAASGSIACGNVSGQFASGNSIIVCNNSKTSYNTYAGLYSILTGSIDADGASTESSFNRFGVYVNQNSHVQFTSATASNNTDYDLITVDGVSYITGGTGTVNDTNNLPAKIRKGSVAHSFGSISANSQATTTLTISGVTVGSSVAIGHNGSYVNGLSLTAFVSAANTVTIIASNITTGSISVGNRTYYATVFQEG